MLVKYGTAGLLGGLCGWLMATAAGLNMSSGRAGSSTMGQTIFGNGHTGCQAPPIRARMERMAMQIGDTLYSKKDYGRQSWESAPIIGETKQSWLVGQPSWPSKVNKKTMLENLKQYGARRWYTEDEMHEKDWRDRNVYRLSKLVEAQDTATLKKIADMVGYTDHTP